MKIDFKEIEPGNKGGKNQDDFELFACDFLESLGYEIIERPSRGPDGKKDLIVSNKSALGVTSDSRTIWLVSCKHNAHSGKSVNDTDEPDISDRVRKHKCHGFMGFYSTIPTTTLSSKLSGYKDQFPSTIYDGRRIEKEIYSLKDRDRILATYFPVSKGEWENERYVPEHTSESNEASHLSIDQHLEISRTAIIQLEIAKIKFKFTYNWQETEALLEQLMIFVDHKNEYITEDILFFLRDYVSAGTRSGMPENIAGSIHSLILSFFPASYGDEYVEKRIENGKTCVQIAYNLTYDAFIHVNNFAIAQWGLNIMKFIYREGKRNDYAELMTEVMNQYKDLIKTLNRPERTDLENAKEFTRVFKDDLEDPSLSFPVLPAHLYELTLKNRT